MMIADDLLLMIPGPTNLPPQVQEALGRPAFYHRGNDFAQLIAACNDGLKKVFQTENDVLILTSSGTGAVEAAIVNVLSPGDKVLVIEGGKFGERMGDIAGTFGAEVDKLDVEAGKAADPAEVASRLSGHKALLFVQNETSTGVRQDADLLAAAAAEAGALAIVDTVSSMGGMSIPCDKWGLNVVASGSQKAFMLPPGLAFVMLDDKAWEASESAKMPRAYFDLSSSKKSLAKGQTPFTPNVSMVRALGAALDLIQAEGVENVWRRHHALAEGCRAWAKASGLKLLADDAHASDVVTAVRSPEGVSSKDLVSRVRDNRRVLISGGQGDLAGKIFRIGHMGCCQPADLLRTLEATALELQGLGFSTDIAAGLDAAKKAYEAAK